MTQDDPQIGYLLADRYRLKRLVGQGGFGAVYAAEHEALGRPFAIKVLSRRADPEHDEATFLKRFEREARVTASLEHPHIVQVTDYGTDERLGSWFAMELLRGEDLQARIQRDGRLDGHAAARVLRQVAEACAYAHKRGVVHRDLKAANVFLVSSDAVKQHVKVLDFGIARLVGPTEEEDDEGRLTRVGSVLGSPAYMAPEQALGHPVDHRTDVYALGVLLYEALTGRVPFRGATHLAILQQHIQDAPTPPVELIPSRDLNPLLEIIVLKCLQKTMNRRYQSTDELAAALAEAEAHIAAGGDAATEINETCESLRASLLKDGEALARASAPERRRIVGSGGHTMVQEAVAEEVEARAGRRMHLGLAFAVLVAALTLGAWWWMKPASPSIATPDPTAQAGPSSRLSAMRHDVGAPLAAPAAASAHEAVAPKATGAPDAAGEESLSPLSHRLVLDTDPDDARVLWKDGRRDPALESGAIALSPDDTGRVLLVTRPGYREREVRVDYEALKGSPLLEIKLEPLPAKPKARPKAKASSKPRPKPRPKPKTGGFLKDMRQ